MKKKVRIKSVPKANSGLIIEDNQYNLLSPNFMELGGKKHSQGGTDLQYGGNIVEAEKGETLTKNRDNDIVVLGNLEYPGTNKKFKTIGKELGKAEAKALKQQDRGFELIEDSNPFNPYSSLSFNAGLALKDAAQQKQASILQKKEELADTQQFMLDLVDATGKKPEKISSIFKNGGKLKPKYKDGGTVEEQSLIALRKALAKQESSGSYTAQPKDPKTGKLVSSAYGKYQFIKPTRKSYYDKYFKDKYKSFDAFELAFKGSPQLQEEVMDVHLRDLSNKFGGDPVYIALAHRLGESAASQIKEKGYYESNGRRIDLNTPIGSSKTPTDRETPGQYLNKLGLNPSGEGTSPFAPSVNYAGQVSVSSPELQIPYFGPDINEVPNTYLPEENRTSSIFDFDPRETGVLSKDETVPVANTSSYYPINKKITSAADMNKLRLTDFLGELAAIGDRPDYVQGQTFEPQLFQPFQMSFQDRLNQNASTFRAVSQQLPNNPAALSVLAAQKYNADNQALAEEFRVNQQMANEVTNKNTGLLNEATVQNLQLRDQQYMRQEQAKANTNMRRQQAIASLSDKFNQNRQQNMTIRMYENMFGYRPNEQGVMEYQGPPAAIGAIGDTSQMYQPTSKKVKKDSNGEVMYTEEQWSAIQDMIDKQKASATSSRKWGGFLGKKK